MKTTLKSTLKALLTLTFILTLLLNGTAFAQRRLRPDRR